MTGSAPPETSESSSEIRTRPPRVLVVDDEPLVLRSLLLVLSREFDVTGTTFAEEALQWLAGGKSYDVILCDVMMPGLDGIALRNRVSGFSPEQAARIVFVTGGLVVPEIRARLDAIPNAVLEKPIDLDGLRELIRRRVRAAWQSTACGL